MDAMMIPRLVVPGLQRRMAIAALIIGAVALASVARAQPYPNRPVTMIVPFPPGGVADLPARLVAQRLSVTVGQTVVTDNRPGAGGTIGTKAAASAAPDGYTLLFGGTSALAIAPSINKNVGYDVLRSFAPVAMVSSLPFVLVVNPKVPARTIQEFVAYAKDNRGKLNYASAGHGTPPHLVVELFNSMAGLDMVHVPYRGGVQSVIDVATGEAQMTIDGTTNVLPLVRDGKLRALAVTSGTRLSFLPDVPTAIEAGFERLASDAFGGVVAPAGTPSSIVSKLNGDINAAVKTLEFKARLAEIGAEPITGTPEDFRSLLARELQKWANIARSAGLATEPPH
jgi:tripartite-type tricarboxylate transporter receptor subunit TctC